MNPSDQNCPNWLKTSQIDQNKPNWLKMSKSDQNEPVIKMSQIDKKWVKVIKMSQIDQNEPDILKNWWDWWRKGAYIYLDILGHHKIFSQMSEFAIPESMCYQSWPSKPTSENNTCYAFLTQWSENIDFASS